MPIRKGVGGRKIVYRGSADSDSERNQSIAKAAAHAAARAVEQARAEATERGGMSWKEIEAAAESAGLAASRDVLTRCGLF